MSLLRKPVLSSELLASRLSFVEGLYVVGPYAGRVSFSSQQRRAISLVCDINEDLQAAGEINGLRGKSVCIVGAGLAGLTCAAVVAALEGRAFVHEKALRKNPRTQGMNVELEEILATVRAAAHRDAHPSLNFWPHEQIEPFTRLPILNWHEDDCASVANQIAIELNQLMEHGKLGNGFAGILNGCTVKDVIQEGRQWRLACDMDPKSKNKPWDRNYDVVILAMGFGEEQGPGKTPSYWENENDAAPVLARTRPAKIKHYVVSGTGDGGLIEALRMTFLELRAGNIDEGMMQALGAKTLRDEVSGIENRAYKRYVDHVLHSKDGQLTDEARNEIADLLWTDYSGLVRSGAIARHVIEGLEDKRSEIRVDLLGRWTHPMELSASPYHRLLITLAIENEWITYHRIKSVTSSKTDTLEVVLKDKKVPISLAKVRAKQFKEEGTKAPPGLEFADAFFLARHGYSSPLLKLPSITGNEGIGRIKRQQSLYSDQDRLQPEYARMVAERFGLADPSNPVAFYRQNYGRIGHYFKLRFDLSIALDETHPPRFLLTGTRRQGDRALPLSLFGCDLDEGRPDASPFKPTGFRQ